MTPFPIATPVALSAPAILSVPPPAVTLETLATRLEHPWALAFLPDGTLLITERPGRLLRLDPRTGARHLINGLPPIHARGQGGLLDLQLAPDFSTTRYLYLCYAEPVPGGQARTAVARAQLSDDHQRLDNVTILFRQEPPVAGDLHFGCRLLFEPTGNSLIVALGDRYHRRHDAQNLTNHLGKTIRIDPRTGAPLMGNYWRQRCQQGEADACHSRPEIYTLGHRNIQGILWHPGTSSPWIVEHGPQGGDELNSLVAGGNYGWPRFTYGEEYGGGKIGEGTDHPPPLIAPLLYWTPSIAPSGMAYLPNDRYGSEWRGAVVVGSLKFRQIHWLRGFQDRILHEAIFPVGERVREVRVGPDGRLYILTDEPAGKLLVLQPVHR